MLTIIDVFSKYAWAVPVKEKTDSDDTAARTSILQQSRKPTNVQTDRGKEFYNATFQSLMQRYGINLYSTYSNLKASIFERFNRTLKQKMWIQFSLRGMYKWLDILSNLLMEYNNSKHRTTGIKPNDITLASEAEVLVKFTPQTKVIKKPKFKIGEKVRVCKIKPVFEKGYTPNWSTEIFTISQVMATNPVTYKLKDYRDQPIAGEFYEKELLYVKYPDVYLVEKVLKNRGKQIYVK